MKKYLQKITHILGFVIFICSIVISSELSAEKPTNSKLKQNTKTKNRSVDKSDLPTPKSKKQLSEQEIARKREIARIRKIYLGSVFLPGIGQIFNNKIWKVGVIWAGLGALGYGAYHFDSKYKKSNEVTDRVWRNGLLVIIFFWYAWNVLDAYVDAQMSNYDISEDVSPDKRKVEKQKSKNKKRKQSRKRLQKRKNLKK